MMQKFNFGLFTKASRFKEIRISLPSVEEQERVVNEIDFLSAETQKLESIYLQKLATLEALKKSLLPAIQWCFVAIPCRSYILPIQ